MVQDGHYNCCLISDSSIVILKIPHGVRHYACKLNMDNTILTGAFLSMGLITNFLSLNDMFLISLQGKPILGVNLLWQEKFQWCFRVLYYSTLILQTLSALNFWVAWFYIFLWQYLLNSDGSLYLKNNSNITNITNLSVFLKNNSRTKFLLYLNKVT